MPRPTATKVATLSLLAAGSFVYASFATMPGASAQEIRRYGEDEESSGGGGSSQQRPYYPGQPMPQQQTQGQQAPSGNQSQSGQESEGEGEGERGEESYEIRVFDPDARKSDRESSDKRRSGEPDSLYQGIIPGSRDIVEHLKDSIRENSDKKGPNLLTWIGFQAEDKRSRVFIQTARQPSYQVDQRKDGRRVVVTLENTEITTENFRRQIDASYFNRNVQFVGATSVDDTTVEVRIDIKESESPKISTDNGYLYLDFDAAVPSKDGQTS